MGTMLDSPFLYLLTFITTGVAMLTQEAEFGCCMGIMRFLQANWTNVKKVDTYATDLSVNFFAKRVGER